MHTFTRSVIIALLLAYAISAGAQSQPQEAKETTASITGQVTIGGNPAAGVIVTLTESDPDSPGGAANRSPRESMVKATTDAEGRYRLENLSEGRYLITPFAPSLVTPREPNWNGQSPGRTITLRHGEAREKVDFALARGGVITGRVTKADGRPAVEVEVKLAVFNKTKADDETMDDDDDDDDDETTNKPQADQWIQYFSHGWFMYRTDDRGIYRIYGLPAGRYLVSVGVAEGEQGYGTKNGYQKQTFHPGVTDMTKATVVELKDGGEVTGADIKLAPASRTYTASGRVVDADTGKPITTAVANYGTTQANNRMINLHGEGSPVNSKGEFKISSLLPGRYYAFASFDEENTSYSTPIPFEITGGDVTGLVVKVRRGQSLSGTVSIEGTNDPETLASLSQLQLSARVLGEEPTAPKTLTAKVAPDGSFRISGVQPGKVYVYLTPFIVPTKLAVLRVERGGVVQAQGIPVSANENPSDVRIILTKAVGVVRGQVNFIGGALPDNVTLRVFVRGTGGNQFTNTGQVEVDARGRFKFENLLPGEYEVQIFLESDKGSMVDKDNQPVFDLEQVVTVTNETEATVTFTVGFNPNYKQ